MAVQFNRHLDSNAADVPVRFQNDAIIKTNNLASSILREILR